MKDDPRTLEEMGDLTRDEWEDGYEHLRGIGMMMLALSDRAWLWGLARITWPQEEGSVIRPERKVQACTPEMLSKTFRSFMDREKKDKGRKPKRGGD
jgi:hypothetical protein